MSASSPTISFEHSIQSLGFRMTGLPKQISALTSVTLVITVLDGDGEALDCSGDTIKLYAGPVASPVAEIELVDGAASGENNNIVTFNVPKNVILEEWGAYKNTRFIVEIGNSAGNDSMRLWQDVQVITTDKSWNEDYPESKDIKESVTTIATDTELTAYPGIHRVYIDTSGGNVQATMPDPETYSTQRVILTKIDAANTATIEFIAGDTINGVDQTITMSEIGDCVELVPGTDANSWIQLVYKVFVR